MNNLRSPLLFNNVEYKIDISDLMYIIPILFNNVGYKFDVSDLIYTSMCHMDMFLLQDKLKPFLNIWQTSYI
jgi:hypothetical protein